ncbi:MAG: hypothetical protein JST20_14160 [Bacteroidetes bacterium]|nr:hypothetical protein [Bacteroidota bacterium]
MAHNGTVLFAGTQEKGVLRSSDNGKTWEMVNNGLSVDKQRLQIFEMLSINSWVFIATSRGVFRTNNDGTSWKLTGSELFIQSMVTNGKAIFTGAGTNGGSDGIYRTTDNGESWQLVKATVPTVFLADGDSVWIDDQSAGQKGISISADGGNTWKAIQTVGNSIVRGKYFKSGTTIFMTELSIFSSGDLLRSEDGGATWTLVTNVGSGVRSVFIFDGWVFAGENRSKDNGATWESTEQNIGTYATAIGKTMYFGMDEMYRSSNYIKSTSLVNCFYPIYSMLMSEQVGLHIGTDDGYFIYGRSKYVRRDIDDNKQHTYYSLAQNGTSIYAGTEDGIYSFADSLVLPITYTQVGLSGTILSLGVNGTSSYAGTNSGIYRLKNGSKTWEKQTQVGTSAVRVIVVNNGTVTVGTDNGVYISTNDGQSWR